MCNSSILPCLVTAHPPDPLAMHALPFHLASFHTFITAELKAKEANMRELVRLAEEREARAKQNMAALLAERAEVFDAADSARREPARVPAAEQAQQEQCTQQVEAAGQPAAEGEPAEALAEHAEEAVQQAGTTEHASPAEAAAAVPLPAGSSVQEGDAFGPQQTAVSTASMGEAGPTQDEEDTGQSPAVAEGEAVQAAGISMEAAPGPAEAPSASTPAPAAAGAGPAAPAAAVNSEMAAEQQLLERQAAIAEARRRQQTAKEKFAKLSQVCVAADQVRLGVARAWHRAAGAGGW